MSDTNGRAWARRGVAVVLAWLVFAGPGMAPAARAIHAIYAFGDSLTDTGNNPAPAVGYFEGRYSNGPLWIEYLSGRLGLAYNPADNHAESGGETSGALLQVQQFAPPTNAATSLFVVWAGGNDFIHNFAQGLNDTFWNGLINQSVANLSNAVVRLYADGARLVVVPNQVDLSRIPLVLDSGQPFLPLLEAYLQGKVKQFNTTLAAALADVARTRPDLQLVNLDVYGKFDTLLGNLGSNGFTRADPDALSDTALADKSFTGPGADYVFWDPIHPTTRAHALVADWMYSALPVVEPPLETLNLAFNGGGLQLNFTNLRPGQLYTLQTSSNLVDWADAGTLSATNAAQTWSGTLDFDAQSFFRLKW